jgi:restriction system protein
MPADEFCAALAKGFERDGYKTIGTTSTAELRLMREGIVTLVACRRWKAGRTGVEPLREFDTATRKEGAARIYVAVGEVTENARTFARDKNIRLLNEEDLARLLR